MLGISKSRFRLLYGIPLVFLFLLLTSCSNDNPVDSGGANAKVTGKVTGDSGLYKSLKKSSGAESIQGISGATVILAQVQADGSLKTVSTQSVQTDLNGSFTVETSLSSAQNLVVVATKGASQWKAVVYSEVKSNSTVYCQPVNTQTTAHADVYSQIVVSGQASTVSSADLQMYLTSSVAAQINSSTTARSQFASCLASESQVRTQASSHTYFGVSNSQLQTIENARAQASVAFQSSLHSHAESQSSASQDFRTYQQACLAAYTSASVKLEAYAKLLRVSSRAYITQSAQMSSSAYFSASQSISAYLAVAIRSAAESKFQEAGASSAQMSAVTSAGVTLSASIAGATTIGQINDAYVQYHNTVVAQLKVVLSAYASLITTLDANINAAAGVKANLNVALSGALSTSQFINAYTSFYSAIAASVQTTLTGASGVQVSSITKLLILANMN